MWEILKAPQYFCAVMTLRPLTSLNGPDKPHLQPPPTELLMGPQALLLGYLSSGVSLALSLGRTLALSPFASAWALWLDLGPGLSLAMFGTANGPFYQLPALCSLRGVAHCWWGHYLCWSHPWLPSPWRAAGPCCPLTCLGTLSWLLSIFVPIWPITICDIMRRL